MGNSYLPPAYTAFLKLLCTGPECLAGDGLAATPFPAQRPVILHVSPKIVQEAASS